jgi:subtilisin family serine protease
MVVWRFPSDHAPRVFVAVCLLLIGGTADAQSRRPLTKLPYTKLDSSLAQVVVAVDAGQQPATAVGRLQSRLGSEDTVAVSIRANDPVAALILLRELGARVANEREDVVEAFVTPAILRRLNASPAVRRVSQIRPFLPLATSQGVSVHNAANWQAHNRRGTGVKVGVIDSFAGFSPLMGTELPSAVITRCYSFVGIFSSALADCEVGSNHGTAVAESLVDIAPDVELYIANPISRLDLLNTVDWMTAQGVRIINFSQASVWDGPGDGTSPYAESPLKAVDAAVSNGALFVSAAGNHGEATYFGAFVDQNGNNFAEFPGTSDQNSVVLPAGQTLIVQLRWQDSWTAANSDLDLGLYDSSGNLVAASVNIQEGIFGDTPFEVLGFIAPATGVYYIVVHRFAGSVPAWIQLQNFTQQPLGAFTTSGSIASPAESANGGALAVGATAWNATNGIESFSSRGPTPDGRTKPDIVGVDRAETSTYGPDGFAGTSQAAPHVAGLAALVLQAFPSLTPTQVASYLTSQAIARSAPVPNNTWGYGLAMLPSICTYSLFPGSAAIGSSGGVGTVTLLTEVGCSWIAESLTAAVAIIGGGTGSGNGNVTYSVAPNPGHAPRSLTLRIAGLAFIVVQRGTASPALDLNGDGRLDFLWHHQTDGRISGWVMNGTQLADGTLLTPGQVSDTSWQVAGAGDLNGDGHTDIVWQNIADGRTSAWLMNGLQMTEGTLFSIPQVADTNWRIRSVGDLNGDGRADLFWQHRGDGRISVWLMDGVNVIAGTLLSPSQVADTNWKIVGTADFDGNGSRDLVWHHQADGRIAVWLMNGTTLVSGTLTSPGQVADTNWKIRAVGDLNTDGKPDLIWQHIADGRISVWLMDGLTLVSGTLLTPSEVPDTNWHIVGPR